jgi:MerR family mercuric resistance operon transcriptional regulator
MAQPLTIGRLAKLAEVNVESVRYYQRRGLLAEPAKPQGGYRRYPADAVKRIRFIKRAQVLGFTLEEIGGLLQLAQASACAKTRTVAERKLALTDRKVADLSAMRKALDGLVRQCRSGESRGCPIIQALSRD